MIRIHVYWWQCVYTGSAGNSGPEWPPSPRRIFAALTAGAHRGSREETVEERAALRVLAATPPPSVWVPETRRATLPVAFVPSTSLPERGKALAGGLIDTSHYLAHHDTRAKGEWTTMRTNLADPEVCYDIDDGGCITDQDIECLNRAAKRVGYVGRATHIADISVERSEGGSPGPLHHRMDWRVSPAHTGQSWDPQTLDDLDRRHQAVFVHGTPPGTDVIGQQFGTYVRAHRAREGRMPVLRLARNLPGAQAPTLMAELNSLLSDTVQAVPLLQVGFEHSTGVLSGIGIVSSDPASAQETWVELLADSRFEDPVSHPTTTVLNPAFWSATASSWYSASPCAVHPDARIASRQLARHIEESFGAAPTDITLSTSPTHHGHGRWPVQPGRGQRQWWVQLTMADPIDGPVILGDAQEAGFGVFRPRRDS